MARISAVQQLFLHQCGHNLPRPNSSVCWEGKSPRGFFPARQGPFVSVALNQQFLPLLEEILCEGRSKARRPPAPPWAAQPQSRFSIISAPQTEYFWHGRGGWLGSDGSCRWKTAPELSNLLRPPPHPQALPGPTGLGGLAPHPPLSGQACASRPGSVPSPHMASP